MSGAVCIDLHRPSPTLRLAPVVMDIGGQIDVPLLESRLRGMDLMPEWKRFAALTVGYLGIPIDAMPLYSAPPCVGARQPVSARTSTRVIVRSILVWWQK